MSVCAKLITVVEVSVQGVQTTQTEFMLDTSLVSPFCQYEIMTGSELHALRSAVPPVTAKENCTVASSCMPFDLVTFGQSYAGGFFIFMPIFLVILGCKQLIRMVAPRFHG